LVNIIIVHPWDVVFPRAKDLGKTTPLGWTIMMFTLSAGNNCILLYFSILFLKKTLNNYDVHHKCRQYLFYYTEIVLQ
jgi:hypothetical protein